MFLVTGATGHLGSAAIDHLLTQVGADQVVAFARSEAKAEPLRAKGVDVRFGDYDNSAALEQAMQGVRKVLLVSSNDHGNLLTQHMNVVGAAEKAGVEHVVYTGTAVKDAEASPMSPMLTAHFRTEDHLRSSGIAHTILRNSMYTDALPFFLGEKVFDLGVNVPAGNGRIPFALRREMGEAAANVLLQDGHEDKTYELTASEAHTFADIAHVLSERSGKPVAYVSPDPQTFADGLRSAGVPEFGVTALSAFITDMREGRYEIITRDLENLLGRKPMPLSESLTEVYSL
ncbi:SDR family oxidoreductase [Streptomyces sp. NPDC059255]|uniref:SDR family oxidoreductase n=1 Tax=Streptomyces sp. NPDC059255 TaxID=3346793 RepID=UPI0036AED840